METVIYLFDHFLEDRSKVKLHTQTIAAWCLTCNVHVCRQSLDGSEVIGSSMTSEKGVYSSGGVTEGGTASRVIWQRVNLFN